MNTQELLKFHEAICARARDIVRVKNNDYSGSSGQTPFANFQVAEQMSICKVETGFQIRIGDKFMRLVTFSQDGTLKVEGEGPIDSCIDIINYMILLAAFIQSERKTIKFI